VRLWTTAKHQRRTGVFAVALMLVLWLAAFALTASPGLHRLLHADSKSPDHRCLITQLQQHPLYVGAAPIVAPVSSPAGLAFVSRPEFQYLPLQDSRLSPSRGPPILVSSFPVGG